MSFAARLEQARQRDADTEIIAELARDAQSEGEEERALPIILAVAEQRAAPLLWQWAGLLNRALDRHALALDCLATAASLAPADARIAQGRAHVAFEAGLDAIGLYEQARRLAPQDPAVLVGLNAARMAGGQAQRAVTELESALEQSPLWIQGHLQYAQLQSLLGDPAAIFGSLDRALGKQPRDTSLWLARCDLCLRQEDYAALGATVAKAETVGAAPSALAFYRAVAAAELGDPLADDLLSEAAIAANPALAVWRIRHLLRQGRVAQAVQLIDRELASDRSAAAWPYAATAWRLAGDPRSGWLEQPGLVSIVDLAADIAPVADLADRLRALHQRSGQYLDQSVRGGSQTDGPLLSRVDPAIQNLRAAIVGAVEHYLAQLPPADSRHPLLAPPRDRRIRFSGSWSVRLGGGGRHSNHVHPLGWISSALYLALPRPQAGEPPDAGWLVLGEPPAELGVDLPPHTIVEPKVGRLMLFPSWMWHGTRPFAEGERLTVAFDVAPPR
ncbi:MAG: putative 2OG-Fe(II) oxygenase [Sphingomicrobium sp.]